MLSAVSQTDKDKYHRISLKCGSKKAKHPETETRIEVTRSEGWGRRGDVGQRVQSSCYKMIKF